MLLCFAGLAHSQYSDSELRAIDSLRQITQSDAHDTLKVEALNAWDEIIYAYDQQLDVFLNESVINITTKNLDKKDISLREREFYMRYKGIAMNNVGLVMIEYGNYVDALKNILESLQIAEYFDDSLRRGNALNNIGMIYDHMGMTEKAVTYYDSSMIFSSGDAFSYCTYYNNIGLCYFQLGQLDSALSCYEKSLVFADSAYDIHGKGNTLTNIGLVYSKRDDCEEAIKWYNRSIETYQLVNDNSGISTAYKNIGLCHDHMGNYKTAIDFCERAYSMSSQNKATKTQKESCLCLHSAYKHDGNTAEALKYHELYVVYLDSLESTEKNLALHKIDFQVNYNKLHLQDSLKAAAEYAVRDEMKSLKYAADLAHEEKMQYILFAGIGVALLLGGISFRSYRLKKRDNEIIARQKEEVESQKELVEEKNKEITDSINYAKRIQEAILPNRELFSTFLPESFILYKPKDIVAGDFYWLEKAGDRVIFAVADCTGHGVPGAMVSVVCHNALNRAVKEFGLISPEKILDKTRELVIETFEKGELRNLGQKSDVIRDGMDIALCVYDTQKSMLYYSGANNGLYHVRNGAINEFTADKQPIGKYAEEKPFSCKQINVQKNDLIFLYSDGYADQFGGADGKKFKYKQLKELILKNASLNLAQQNAALDSAFEKWKGNLEQIDDVCLMGVRL